MWGRRRYKPTISGRREKNGRKTAKIPFAFLAGCYYNTEIERKTEKNDGVKYEDETRDGRVYTISEGEKTCF